MQAEGQGERVKGNDEKREREMLDSQLTEPPDSFWVFMAVSLHRRS